MKSIGAGIFTMICLLQIQLALAQEITVANVPEKNTARMPIPTGRSVFGVFDGRSPCQDIAKEINVKTIPECIKIKWRLILFRDSITFAPTTYKLEGFVYRNPPKTGKWAIIHGTKTNPDAVVFVLDPADSGGFMYLLKADDNVLFLLDMNRRVMVGNENFSYVLYRTAN
jgi:hypothetical protein